MSDQAIGNDIKALIEKYGYDGGIFIGLQIDKKDGLSLVTWGRNASFWKAMRHIGDQLLVHIQDGTVELKT